MLQRSSNPARFPSGQAVDVTIGVPSVASADKREADKQQKFASQLAVHPHLEFSALGITTDGDIGPQAHTLMCQWSAALARLCHSHAVPPGNPRGEVSTAVARAFVRPLVFQLVQWKLHARDAGRPGLPRFM